jgi:hypothetical protein
MINIDIAFDNGDVGLGDYFEQSKIDLVSFVHATRNDHLINEIPGPRCNQAYIDLRVPAINGGNFLFVCYSHGKEDSLTANGDFYIKKDVNCELFINSFFYSMSCLTAKELGVSLLGKGCHVFIGFKEEAGAFLGAYQSMSIACDNFAIKKFVEGYSIGESVALMKQNYTRQIDVLENDGEPMLAAELRANRDALWFDGDRNLTIDQFAIN